MKNWMYAALVFLGGCCFGVLSTFVKLAYGQGFTLAVVSGSQFLCGTLLLWVVLPFVKKQYLSYREIFKLIVSGIPMGLTGILYYQSLQTLDASLAIIFLFQFVWLGSLLEYIIDRKKPSVTKILSILILILGSIFAAGVFQTTNSSLSGIGTIWGLMAALSFSIFIYTSGTVGKHVPAIQKSSWLAVGGLLIVFIIFPPFFLVDVDTLVGVAPFGIFLGLFGVTLPPFLFSIGMPRVGSGLGTILSSSELPVAIIMSAVILAEYIAPLQWFGVIVILVGIIIGNKRQVKQQPHASLS
ncbi:EamA family transporter [Bacillus solitudinis]|uniref:EamA family transporter n=1 Tax=Bacillus solitudinis TaxID=2014074 RepID=UPI000C23FADC|nr:DMT family transporter [Bacillus solitudinis]